MKSAKPGDIIQIETTRGVALARFMAQDPFHGALLDVFNEIHSAVPRDIFSAISKEPAFQTFFPLNHAVRNGIVKVVGHCPVPAGYIPPLFRVGFRDRNGIVEDWWLWDGNKEWKVGKLTSEQKRFPIRRTINDAKLVELIEREWTPESDFE